MKNKFNIIFLVLLSTMLIYNCSDVKEDISQPEELEGVHPDGFGEVGSDNFHSFKLQATNWALTECQKCHASNYTGGLAGVSCLDCHTSAAGPEACNTCHGVFADETRIAPPNDINNNFETSAKGVGAHTSHVYENELTVNLSCFQCHPSEVGEGEFIKAHIDGLPAEISFGNIATLNSADPNYNNDLSCSNSYCHGNFNFRKDSSANQWAYTDSLITGENFAPIWNIVDDTQAACGTCHMLPPNGHISAGTDPDAATCKGCHTAAFNEDGTLNKFTHIDGEITYQ